MDNHEKFAISMEKKIQSNVNVNSRLNYMGKRSKKLIRTSQRSPSGIRVLTRCENFFSTNSLRSSHRVVASSRSSTREEFTHRWITASSASMRSLASSCFLSVQNTDYNVSYPCTKVCYTLQRPRYLRSINWRMIQNSYRIVNHEIYYTVTDLELRFGWPWHRKIAHYTSEKKWTDWTERE